MWVLTAKVEAHSPQYISSRPISVFLNEQYVHGVWILLHMHCEMANVVPVYKHLLLKYVFVLMLVQ